MKMAMPFQYTAEGHEIDIDAYYSLCLTIHVYSMSTHITYCGADATMAASGMMCAEPCVYPRVVYTHLSSKSWLCCQPFSCLASGKEDRWPIGAQRALSAAPPPPYYTSPWVYNPHHHTTAQIHACTHTHTLLPIPHLLVHPIASTGTAFSIHRHGP